jgi:hypothetical protein
MANSLKKVLGALGATALLAGCATGYYDNGYGYYGEPYAYGYGSSYYGYPGYYGGPSIGFGATYVERDDYRRGWHRDHDGRWRDRDGNVRPDATFREPVTGPGVARSDDGTLYSRPLGQSNGTQYWQGSDGRVYEGTLPPGKNPTASGG